jgi:type II restriction/modification system DNA methylase subunit YeeA
MNTNKLKVYAPTARREFIQAVTERAHIYGISENGIDPCEVNGDYAIINGRAFPSQVDVQRNKLEEQVKRKGFGQVMEAVAYTWFNRFVAIRYMELHRFLSHGYHVLSHPEGNSIPEILEKAQHVELTGLDKEEVIKLKMDGTKDEELYSKLLVAECNELSKAMPFLFERVQDYTELLLPDNLLNTDSVIRQMVDAIPEEDWQEIEIIGWLYQFYISEKKDQVIGKAVKSEDIPAATQLFTPNWIVKYMVQNSLGAQWLATYPKSPVKGRMEYYIEPAEQADEVKAQIAAITPRTINPEELTLIDPACGSGHILVEAYEHFKAIYLERGYRQRDVAQLILEKNLFGLDIDERAAQLTGFALMMKGRADDRRLFERGVKLNVMALVDSAGFDAEGLAKGVKLADYGLQPEDLTELKRLFENATTFGSLIQVPEGLAEKLPSLKHLSEAISQDLFTSDTLLRLGPLVHEAELLVAQYDAVVANPPYMGGKGMNATLKDFAKREFPECKSDLFAMFIQRNIQLANANGYLGFMTPFVWMFLSSYEKLRHLISNNSSIINLVKPSYTAFFESAIVALNSFVLRKNIQNFTGDYFDLGYLGSADSQPVIFREAINNSNSKMRFHASNADFDKIPGSPIAFWLSQAIFDIYDSSLPLEETAVPCIGLQTGDNDSYIRFWYESSLNNIGFGYTSSTEVVDSSYRWFPFNKGGGYRRWYGNQEYVVDWESDGYRIKEFAKRGNPSIRSTHYYFRPTISWSKITSSEFAIRFYPAGLIFADAGCCIFTESESMMFALLGCMNSHVMTKAIAKLSPTMNFEVGQAAAFPVISRLASNPEDFSRFSPELISISKEDWNSVETSWDFQSLPILTASSEPAPSLESSYTIWITQNRDTIAEMKRLEEENNRLFIDAYGLEDELTPDVPVEQITLTVNPAYRYGGKLTEEEQWLRFRRETMEEIVSYVIGCMMGRYSLDSPGLIYAHSEGDGFDPNKYTTFPADEDGIIPITDHEWFDDDAACRLFRFIETAWDKKGLDANLDFIAEAIGCKANESSREAIRRYFVNGFYKNHSQTYKKRPIYWMFTSGKEKAFQALVYLHRYNEGTIARMRTEYVLPLQSKMTTRMEHLEKDKDHAASTSAANKIQKEIGKLRKQKEELLKFDEKLRHYADMKIRLDLDDGVKVNYGKFGDLLAEVKAITGGKKE